MPLVTSGLALIALNSGGMLALDGNIKFGPVQISIDNEPDWLLVLLGTLLVVVGIWILYVTQIRVASSVYEKIQALNEACREPNRCNLDIQERFFSLYKFKASVVVIRFLLNTENPHLSTLDYKNSRQFVECETEGFKQKFNANLKRRERWASIGYFLTAFPGFILFVCGFILAAQSIPNYSIWGWALIFLGVVLAFFAWFLLEQVKALNGALRLLALPEPSSLTSMDFSALNRVMSNLNVSALEYFIEKGHAGYFYSPIFIEITSFASAFETATFHISHVKLRESLRKFYSAWQGTMLYGQFFRETANPYLHRFDFPMDLPRNQYESDLHDRYMSNIALLEQEFKGLVEAIRKYAPNLDIYSASILASQGRSSSGIAVSERV